MDISKKLKSQKDYESLVNQMQEKVKGMIFEKIKNTPHKKYQKQKRLQFNIDMIDLDKLSLNKDLNDRDS